MEKELWAEVIEQATVKAVYDYHKLHMSIELNNRVFDVYIPSRPWSFIVKLVEDPKVHIYLGKDDPLMEILKKKSKEYKATYVANRLQEILNASTS